MAEGWAVSSLANWRQVFEGLWSRGPSKAIRLHLILPFDTGRSKMGPLRGKTGQTARKSEVESKPVSIDDSSCVHLGEELGFGIKSQLLYQLSYRGNQVARACCKAASTEFYLAQTVQKGKLIRRPFRGHYPVRPESKEFQVSQVRTGDGSPDACYPRRGGYIAPCL